MNYLKHLLSILSIYCFLIIINAKAVNITVWETENDFAAWDRVYIQMEALKTGNDILKLRLEMIELQIGKLTHFVTEIDQKLQTIDNKLTLPTKPQLIFRNATTAATGLSGTISGITHDIGIAPSEDSTTVESASEKTQIDEVIRKNHTGDQLQTETEAVFMTDINGKAEPKICKTNADKSLMCSDIVLPTSCGDSGSKACSNNKCYIQNRLYGANPFWVSCDQTTDDGGWTVIQRRINGSVDFYRGWADYKEGFGELDGEFWIGLDKLHALTNTFAPVELYVRLIDFDDVEKYAKYESFAIGGEETNYTLIELGAYSGTAGDSLEYHTDMMFTTKDRDNDNSSINCAELRSGAWWYDSCSHSNLNSRYFGAGTKPVKGNFDGVNWYSFHDSDYSMKFAQMMIRPRKV